MQSYSIPVVIASSHHHKQVLALIIIVNKIVDVESLYIVYGLRIQVYRVNLVKRY